MSLLETSTQVQPQKNNKTKKKKPPTKQKPHNILIQPTAFCNDTRNIFTKIKKEQT